MRVEITTDNVTDTPNWSSLFNQFAFYNLHQQTDSIFFSFKLKNKIIGICNFTRFSDGIYKSPYRGTYGGISFRKDLDLPVKQECVELLIDYFKQLKACKIIIVSEPFAHDLHQAGSMLSIYLSNGFFVSNHEINHALEVDGELLLNKMKRNNKKRLFKCERSGFVFRQCFEPADLKHVYEIIRENRRFKGLSVSMTFEQIMQMYEVFRDNLYFFKVSFDGVDVASAVCLKLNSDILYVFYWGDLMDYRKYSPIVYLASKIYDFAAENNFKLLDAGVSSINGEPNYGLISFKEGLGFSASPKLTYTLNL